VAVIYPVVRVKAEAGIATTQPHPSSSFPHIGGSGEESLGAIPHFIEIS